VKIAGLRKNATGYFGVIIVALLLAAAGLRAQQATTLSGVPGEVSLALDPQQSSVHWTLDSTLHTVHGTFLLKHGAMQFDPQSGKASGEIVVAASSAESGNDSRDKKMHQEILESAKYPEVIFRPDRIDGKIPASGSWNAGIHGVFVLHGAEHELTVPVQGEFTGDHWKGTAKFTVPYIQWGLKNPSNFLLKVNPEVDVELDMSGGMQTASPK
jgi:polyisoprenoid-binding protein YceI